MRVRFSLSSKILLIAFANLAILVLVFIVFARLQFNLGVNSFLTEPARGRVTSIAREMALDLGDLRLISRDTLLQRYSKTYGAAFYLAQIDGKQIAGPHTTIPPEVLDQMHRRPPRPRPPPRRRPPPKEEDGRSGPPPDDPPGLGREGDPPPDPEARPPGPPVADGQPPVFMLRAGSPTMYWAGAGIPVRDHDREGQEPVFLLISSRSLLGTPLFFDYGPWLSVASATLAVIIVCWLPFIRQLTGKVSRLSRVTSEIAEGRFDHNLTDDGGDEVAQLTAGILRMEQRIAGFVSGQKRFLGDIAHELCAPIARLQFALGILEHKTEPGALDDVQEEVRQMSTLVSELLMFSKTGMRESPRKLGAVNVGEIIRQAVAREGATAEISVQAGASALADPDYLLRSVSNLVRNAVRYAGGPIEVTARRDRDEIAICIADRGPGLPPEEVERVFTPFYRVETSRNRATGGTGLGLAIVRNCVEACRGTVTCRNRVPAGLEVEIRLQSAT